MGAGIIVGAGLIVGVRGLVRSGITEGRDYGGCLAVFRTEYGA